ncbi:hypothetical protein Q1695_015666 [Nippostrongylus brasiliensis]|nr:hypothetical protein Q1695_015666 [Nippostrongylus brasiliensis]
MTDVEQSVVRRLFSIARDVLDRRATDDDVSSRIEEAFRNGGQGLCARYKRLPGDLCKPKAQPTIPGAQPTIPVPTGPSASSDEKLRELINALMDATYATVPPTLQKPFQDSLKEALKHLPVPTEEGFKKIAGKIRDDIAKVKGACIPGGIWDSTCKDIYDRTGDIIDKNYDLFTTVLPTAE